MVSSEPPIGSEDEPIEPRPVLPSGIEAGLVGGFAVLVVFLIRDLLAGAPLQTPSVLGTLLIVGPDAAITVVSAPGAAIAYNVIHFAAWILIGSVGNVLMWRVEESASNWYQPWIAVSALLLGCVAIDSWASGAGLSRLHLWLGAAVGIAATGLFLGWRHPRAMNRARGLAGE